MLSFVGDRNRKDFFRPYVKDEREGKYEDNVKIFKLI